MPLQIEISWLNLSRMNNETTLLFEEKIAKLQGFMNQLQTEKLKMQAEIDILTKEKTILMNALEKYSSMEETFQEVRAKNAQLESQLQSLVSSIEKMEQGL
jgi:hypothetical protein